jgi:Glycosyl transferase 4-like domain
VKRVVVLAPDFAPSSYPPAIRARLFTRHLPDFGWEPTVISTKPEFYEWAVDPEIQSLLPADLDVVRTDAVPLKWSRRIGIGDIGMRTLVYHWRALSRLCRAGRVDLVFISVPPSISMVLGRLAHERYNIPYVIDYQDPWGPPELTLRTAWSRSPKLAGALMLARLLEPFAIKKAGHITAVSQGMLDVIGTRYRWLSPQDMTEIPFGAEEYDFGYVRRHPRVNGVFDKNDGLVHVSYIGAYIPQMGDGLRAIFAAIRLGLERDPGLFKLLRFHFVGTTYAPTASAANQVVPIAEESGLADLVDEQPARVSYLDAIQLMLDSHGIAILGSSTRYYAASKVYPSILAQRPLLAILHEDSTSALILKETQVGEVVTFGPNRPATASLEPIHNWLHTVLSGSLNGNPPTRWDIFERYTAREMTNHLSGAFDKAVLHESRSQLGRNPI